MGTRESFGDQVSCSLCVVACVALGIALRIFPLMLAWNWTIPGIFGLGRINFWQALGLDFLAAILTKRGSEDGKRFIEDIHQRCRDA